MTDKLLSKEQLVDIIDAVQDGEWRASDLYALLSHIRAQAELLAAAETALEEALPMAEQCLLNHYGDNPEGSAEPTHIAAMRATLTRIREARK